MDITLALGGGGVKGFSHIGVLRILEQNGFRIRSIAGTSMGGMIGCAYALGFGLDEIEKVVCELNQNGLYRRESGDGPSLLGLKGVTSVLSGLLGEATFDDLKIPFVTSAVELATGQQIVLNRGKIIDALLAATAIPGVFPPRNWEGQLMVDGGILDPVPVALARRLSPSLPVVAVVLSPSLQGWQGKRPMPRFLTSLPLYNRLQKLRWVQSFDIFMQSIDLASCMLVDLRLQVDEPEVIIRPACTQFGLIDHVNAVQLIRIGEEATQAALPDLWRVIRKQRHWSNKLPWISPFWQRNIPHA